MATKYKVGEKDQRHWGSWQVIDTESNYCLKILKIKPHSQISKQLHYHRAEIWYVSCGSGFVTINQEQNHIMEGDIIRIEPKQVHYVKADSKGLTLIELQKGEILDENDIVRFT